jgi:hypothetical protein
MQVIENIPTMITRVSKRLSRECCHLRLLLSDPPPIERPIFLVGTVRGGTTLLAKCLGAHPEVHYLGFELSREWCELADMEIAGPGPEKPSCPPYTEADATEELRQKARSGFARIFFEKGGQKGKRLLNKNPHLWNKIAFVKAIFPDAGFVVTSRDIRSSAASTKLLWMKMEKDWGIKHYLPQNPEYCWSCTPPASVDTMDPSRVFPGGHISVLADYWLRAHEMIERTCNSFDTVLLVKHREFVARPQEALNQIQSAIGLSLQNYTMPEKLETSRNDRWRDILTAQEKDDLENFIETHRDRILRLKFADTQL